MKLPKTVNVCGMRYRVERVPIPSEFDHSYDALVMYAQQEIRVREGLADEYTIKAFLHEVVHAIFDAGAIDQDEQQVTLLSNLLYQVLRDNPELVALFKGAELKEHETLQLENGQPKN